jgi:hypothetical protein
MADIMELHLRYRSSGKLVTLRRAKVLSNSSSRPDGKTKLAFFVPYRSRWVFYPLHHGPRIQYNDEPAPGPCKLSAGDLISLNGSELIVEALSVDEPLPASPREAPPPCWLTILGGTERWHTSTQTELLIGSAEHCGLCLPPTPGVEAEHAFLAYAEGAWHIHSLTGQPDLVQALGHEGRPSVRLEDNDRIWLGSSGLSIRFSPEAPNEPAPPPSRPKKASPFDTHPEHNLEETAANSPPEPPPTEEIIPPVTDHSQEPTYASAKQLCFWLHKSLRDPPPSASRVWEALVAVKTRLGRRSKELSVALEQIKADLEQSPHNRDLLIELARLLEGAGYFDLCRLVLAEVHVLEPKDFDTLLALVKLYLMEGRQTARPLGERLDMLNKAERWGRKAQLLRPKHDELLTLVQQAEVEQTLLKGNLGSGSHRTASLAGH